jgi:regulator of RNase E activity RraB
MGPMELLFSKQPETADGRQNVASVMDQDDADMAIVAALRELGADLTQPREVIHYLFTATHEKAETLRQTLRTGGFEVGDPVDTAYIEESETPWMIRAVTHGIVNETTVRRATAEMTELATRHDGKYDGWEACGAP